jgi:hypothetical protein
MSLRMQAEESSRWREPAVWQATVFEPVLAGDRVTHFRGDDIFEQVS